jgi:hypothetical protein
MFERKNDGTDGGGESVATSLALHVRPPLIVRLRLLLPGLQHQNITKRRYTVSSKANMISHERHRNVHSTPLDSTIENHASWKALSLCIGVDIDW